MDVAVRARDETGYVMRWTYAQRPFAAEVRLSELERSASIRRRPEGGVSAAAALEADVVAR